jgi:hypothetical protein
MQCRDVRELFDSFLAEELPTETNHEILRHLETCPACRAELSGRRALRTALQEAFARAADLKASPDFLAHLGATLQRSQREVLAHRVRLFRGWWALAAMLVVGVVVSGVFLSRGWFTSAAALARAAVGDHRNCALKFRLTEKPISLEEAAERYGGVYRALETVPAADVVTAGGTAHIVERHSCVYAGHRFAHIVLRYHGTLVSLLVTAADGAPSRVPPEALPHLTPVDRIDAMSVVSFHVTRHVVFLTGDLDRSHLARLADAVAGPIYQRLSGI